MYAHLPNVRTKLPTPLYLSLIGERVSKSSGRKKVNVFKSPYEVGG